MESRDICLNVKFFVEKRKVKQTPFLGEGLKRPQFKVWSHGGKTYVSEVGGNGYVTVDILYLLVEKCKNIFKIVSCCTKTK